MEHPSGPTDSLTGISSTRSDIQQKRSKRTKHSNKTPTRRSMKATDGEDSCNDTLPEFSTGGPSPFSMRSSGRQRPSRGEESGLPSARGHSTGESPTDLGTPKAGTTANVADEPPVGGNAREEPHLNSSVADAGVPKAAALDDVAVAASEEAIITTAPLPTSGALVVDEHASPGPVGSPLVPAEPPSDNCAVRTEDAAEDAVERQHGPSSTCVEETAGMPRAKKRISDRSSGTRKYSLRRASAFHSHQRCRARSSSEWTTKLPRDMTCVLLVVVGLVIVLVVWLVTVNQQPEIDVGTSARYCHTEGCLRHAQLISTSLNKSVDPCEDFDAFACSGLEPCQHCEHSSYGSTLATRALHEWFSDFRDTLELGKGHLRAGAKALAMFDACMAPTGKEDAEAGKLVLRKLMAQLHIPWPDEPKPGVDPLGVLVQLAYRWNLGLWFDLKPPLKASTGTKIGPRTLIVSPGAFVAFWSLHDQEIQRQNGTVAYWNNFYDEFAAGRPTLGEAYIEDVARVAKGVFDELTHVINNENKEPAVILLGDIEKYTPNLAKDRWTKALDQVVTNAAPYGSDPGDRLVVTDVALLKALDGLFTAYSNVELLRHLSWFFIQVFAALADRSLLRLKFGSQQDAELHKHEFCATEVEDAFGPMVPVVYVYPRFRADMRRTIDSHFVDITQTAADMVSELAWADSASRQVAIAKLFRVRTVLWPPDSLLGNEGLSMLYANFFSTKGFSSKRRLFIEHWIDAQENLRALYNLAHSDTLILPHNYVLPYMKYDYIQNQVIISVAALQGVLKVADSTPAMLYGGLGFSYARHLLRALDCAGLKIDEQGNIVPDSWASPQWRAVSQNRTACLAPAHNGPFPEIPALEVAYAAFQKKVQKGEGIALRVMRDYDEQQVFFITACFTMCRQPNTLKSYGGDCNKAAMNFEPFARAFKCKPGSAMNPSKRCPYFN